jgi:S-adenosylmethionine:tRNA ribosyltransferase-isomerase
MKLSEFKFDLPNNLIALRPAENRDEARLMVVHKDTGKIEHKVFKDIVSYFEEGDVLVGNDTMVFPARLYGRKEKTGAKIEVFLLRELNAEMHLWDVLVDPARKIRVGNKLYFGNGDLVAEVIDNTTSRGRTIRFLFDGDEDAGLHFTKQLMKRLQIKGVDMGFITLHIGLGTFRQVDVEDLTKHKMDSENFVVNQEVVDKVNKALDNKNRVCAIGTTAMRSLESAVSAGNRLKVKDGWTDKFIFPPYDFKICNAMITNFHMPESTLLMMAAAFGGFDLTMEAYKVAKKEKYKFLTYGDAMLII